MAILDDYQNLSAPHIARFASNKNLLITVFTSPHQPVAERSNHTALIKALYPYSIISTMRERTPLPKEVLTQLPNLRLIFTTGMRNLSLDIEACKKAGIIVAGTTPSPPGSKVKPTGYGATVSTF